MDGDAIHGDKKPQEMTSYMDSDLDLLTQQYRVSELVTSSRSQRGTIRSFLPTCYMAFFL